MEHSNIVISKSWFCILEQDLTSFRTEIKYLPTIVTFHRFSNFWICVQHEYYSWLLLFTMFTWSLVSCTQVVAWTICWLYQAFTTVSKILKEKYYSSGLRTWKSLMICCICSRCPSTSFVQKEMPCMLATVTEMIHYFFISDHINNARSV